MFLGRGEAKIWGHNTYLLFALKQHAFVVDMARIAKIVIPGYPHHVTQRGVRSMDIVTSSLRGLVEMRIGIMTTRSLFPGWVNIRVKKSGIMPNEYSTENKRP